MSIYSVTVVTRIGVKEYFVGGKVGDATVSEIKVGNLNTNGDPFEHYCMFDEDGKLLASVNKLCPCDVVYS